jgi:vacuolar-type H+-ATPase subunit E/Vma4
MKYANNTSETIQRILQAIKDEALEPSKTEGQEILATAQAEGEQILFEANEKAKSIVQQAQSKAAEQLQAAKAEIQLALKQARIQLKNDLTQHVFKKEMAELISKEMHKPALIAQAIQTIMACIEKDGLTGSFDILVPDGANEREVVQLLAQSIIDKIESAGELKFASSFGGAILRIHDKNMVVELTENQIDKILDRFISDSLKAFIFSD